MKIRPASKAVAIMVAVASIVASAQAGSPFVRLDPDRGGWSSGTFVNDRIVLSCAHGKTVGDGVTVIVNRTTRIRGSVVWVSQEKDLSFVEVTASANVTPLTIAESYSPQTGDGVLIAGFGGTRQLHERRTTVIGTTKLNAVTAKGELNPYRGAYIQLQANAQPGDSGGALVASGELIGVIYGKLLNNGSQQKDGDGLKGGDCLCVPVERIHEFVAEWNEHLAVERRKAEEHERVMTGARKWVEDFNADYRKRQPTQTLPRFPSGRTTRPAVRSG